MNTFIQRLQFCYVIRFYVAFHVLFNLLILTTVSFDYLDTIEFLTNMGRNFSLDILFLSYKNLSLSGVLHGDKSINRYNSEHNESQFPTHYEQNDHTANNGD